MRHTPHAFFIDGIYARTENYAPSLKAQTNNFNATYRNNCVTAT